MSVGGDVATSSPFSVPFNVKNVSWLFAMSDAQMNCGLDKVVLVSPMQFTSTNVFLVSPQVTIKPGKEGAFRCAIGGEQYNLLRVTPFSLKSASGKRDRFGCPNEKPDVSHRSTSAELRRERDVRNCLNNGGGRPNAKG
jgi:hypothetical protein